MELQGRLDRIRQAGMGLAAISYDPVPVLADFSARQGITFPLLSDPQHRVIDAYGLADPRYLKQKREGIPYPAAYLIDTAGRVAWSRVDLDFRERPPTSEIRAALDALK